MNKKIYSILVALLITMLATSTVYAVPGTVRLSGSPTSGSPLHLDGYLSGLGGYTDGVTIALTGTGTPVTSCTSPGGNQAPGQNPPNITASGSASVADPNITKNGKAPVSVATEDLIGTTLPGKQGGCPNNKWAATIESIAWTAAYVQVTDNTNGATRYEAWFTCHPREGNPSVYDCDLVREQLYH